MPQVPYALTVGSIAFAMLCSRPDITQAMGEVSKYMAESGRDHWIIVKWIIGYLKVLLTLLFVMLVKI